MEVSKNDSRAERVKHSISLPDSITLGAMVLVILLATGLRLSELNTDSLWGDEVFEIRILQKSLSSILADNPLSLRVGVAHAFDTAGQQEFMIRFSYAAWGILAVAAMYRVGRALFGSVTGGVGAFLLAISTFHVQHSQEARSYSLTVLLVLLALHCIYQALLRNKSRHWVAFACLIALGLSNHLTAAAALSSMIAFGGLILLSERLSERSGRLGSVDIWGRISLCQQSAYEMINGQRFSLSSVPVLAST